MKLLLVVSTFFWLGAPSVSSENAVETTNTSSNKEQKRNFLRKLAPVVNTDISIWKTIADSVSPTDSTVSCFNFQTRLGTKSVTGVQSFDYFTTTPDKWVGELLKFGCAKPKMDWSNQMYLTFMAKVEGNYVSPCKPAISISGGGWNQCGSGWCTTGSIPLVDSYVDRGMLVDYEWRRVAIPLANFRTSTWTLTNIVQLGFQSCGTSFSVQPKYNVADIKVTNYQVSVVPALPPTRSPTSSPTAAIWPIWTKVSDSLSKDGTKSCFHFKDRLGTSSTPAGIEPFDYFTTTPDAWVGEIYEFGCSTPPYKMNWSDKTYLTFMAKIQGNFVPPCKPAINIMGGNWNQCGSGWCSTGSINLEGAYVDAGSLKADEWRTVAIPLNNFRTSQWDLSNIVQISFQSCYGDHIVQPTYKIAEIMVTNHYVELLSQPPSMAPTAYWTDDVLLATHRMVHGHWYPILGADREPPGSSWVVASNNAWPIVDPSIAPQTVTVHIPMGQTVVYSGSDSVKYDKLIIEGSLIITPDVADVSLTVGTIVVEEMGSLDVHTTSGSPYKVEITIEGALDLVKDPEQFMVGILTLGGHLTINGNPVSRKMAEINQAAVAGASTFGLAGDLSGFAVGGELVLPDTQTGLNVAHWNFPAIDHYSDQTETCKILSIDVSSGVITCESPFKYGHSNGFNAAYISRSITVKTSKTSSARGHLFGCGMGNYVVSNVRIQDFGRTTTALIDSTVLLPAEGYKFPENMARMNVSHVGTNQIARYALHAHHAMVECYFTGNAIVNSPRHGMVAHDSRVHILDNIVVGANGSAIFLEDGTETGPVMNNYVIGTGGGSRGGDDGRFASQQGTDMGHGGFGIWSRGKLALIQDNHAEGHFGVAPYAFFVHPNFIGDKRIPNVPGTPPDIIGKTFHEIGKMLGSEDGGDGLQLQSYGGFINNTSVGTFQSGLDLSYFGTGSNGQVGSILEGAKIRSLALSGQGMKTTHSSLFTLDDVTFEGTVAGNTITAIFCNNCAGCTLHTPNTTLTILNVQTVRGGNC